MITLNFSGTMPVRVAIVAGWLAAAAQAAVLVPVSYTVPNGEGVNSGGSFNYHDDTYTGAGDTFVDGSLLSGGLGQLTDGVVGVQDWSQNLGLGPAYEWVAWRTITPAITFDLGAVFNVDEIRLHLNNRQAGGVFLPERVTIETSITGIDFFPAATYMFSAAEAADDSARFTAVALGYQARYVRVNLIDGDDNRWVFLSEATIEGTVPAPASAFSAAACLLMFRRRR